MEKRFCDICGEEAKRAEGITHVVPERVKCDKSAHVTARVSFGFQNHSTGFGGPPDLCFSCIHKIIKGLLLKPHADDTDGPGEIGWNCGEFYK